MKARLIAISGSSKCSRKATVVLGMRCLSRDEYGEVQCFDLSAAYPVSAEQAVSELRAWGYDDRA